MTPVRAGRIAWGLAGLAMAVLVAAGLLLVSDRELYGPGEVLLDFASALLITVGFGAVGALIASRRPDNPVGWLSLGIALDLAIAAASQEYAVRGVVVAPGSLPAPEWAAWVGRWIWVIGAGLVGLLFLLFPDGRLPSRRWRPVLWLAVAGLVSGVSGWMFDPQSSAVGEELARVPNPAGVPWLRGLTQTLIVLGAVAGIVAALVSVAGVVVRFRRSRGDARQQIKWLALAGGVSIAIFVGFVAYGIAEVIWPRLEEAVPADLLFWALVASLFVGTPIAFGIAMLRHRLYDVDRLINRTLVYGVLSAILGAVYIAGAVGLGSVVRSLTGQASNSLVVAASTLGVAALFRPVLRRVQGFVDRRFYRSRYDAARTLETFGARLRDQVDLDALSAELTTVVGHTMRPAAVSLWLRAAREGR